MNQRNKITKWITNYNEDRDALVHHIMCNNDQGRDSLVHCIMCNKPENSSILLKLRKNLKRRASDYDFISTKKDQNILKKTAINSKTCLTNQPNSTTI